MATPNPYNDLANSIAMREQGFRGNAENIAKMDTPLTAISAQTGAPSAINPNEIASIAGLANIKAVTQNQSTQREALGKTTASRMPKYVKAYRNYLKWRYPSQYGGGGSTGGVLSSYTVADLPDIAPVPGMNK